VTDAMFWVALGLGAAVVLVSVVGAAVIVAVVLRHRDVTDLRSEAMRNKTATERHSEIKDEMRHLQQLTLRAIGGREALEAAVKDLAERVKNQGGRLEEHSGSISELREKLGLKDTP
jgi:hypothetical protein